MQLGPTIDYEKKCVDGPGRNFPQAIYIIFKLQDIIVRKKKLYIF